MLVPVVDFFIFYFFNKGIFKGISIQELAFFLIDTLSSWAVIYLFLIFIYSLGLHRIHLIRYLSTITLSVSLLFLSISVLFSWQYTISNGYSASVDILFFLIKNSVHAPLHLVQTAPFVFLIFILASFLFAIFLYFIVKKLYFQTASLTYMKNYFHIKVGSVFLLISLVPFLSGMPASVSVSYVFKSPDNNEDAMHVALELRPVKKNITPVQTDIIKKNVIVLLVESLRKDLIEIEPSPAPFLRSLAEESITFTRSYATASHSNYADLAFWYSQYPLRTNRLQTYPRDAEWRGESAFSRFKKNGYATAYISSQNEIWGNMINWLDISDVDYFFHAEDFNGDTWAKNDHSNGLVELIRSGIATAGKVEDSNTLRIAREWIQKNGQQAFFIGLNLQNTHFSYIIPEAGQEPFQPADMGLNAVYYNWPKSKSTEVRNRYYNAVYNQDKIIADFVEFLKVEKLWNDTIFIVVGDSGEAFYEHGFGNHSGPMYDELMRTLTIIKPAKDWVGNKTAHFNDTISHIDILPTVMDMLAMELPETFQGLPVFSKDHSQRPVYMHTNAMVHQNGIVDWPWKLLVTQHPVRNPELYNLELDPDEKNNLIRINTDTANRLGRKLELWVAAQIAYYKYPINFKYHYPPRYIEKSNERNVLDEDRIH